MDDVNLTGFTAKFNVQIDLMDAATFMIKTQQTNSITFRIKFYLAASIAPENRSLDLNFHVKTFQKLKKIKQKFIELN